MRKESQEQAKSIQTNENNDALREEDLEEQEEKRYRFDAGVYGLEKSFLCGAFIGEYGIFQERKSAHNRALNKVMLWEHASITFRCKEFADEISYHHNDNHAYDAGYDIGKRQIGQAFFFPSLEGVIGQGGIP